VNGSARLTARVGPMPGNAPAMDPRRKLQHEKEKKGVSKHLDRLGE